MIYLYYNYNYIYKCNYTCGVLGGQVKFKVERSSPLDQHRSVHRVSMSQEIWLADPTNADLPTQDSPPSIVPKEFSAEGRVWGGVS